MRVLLIRNKELGPSCETNITGLYPPLGLAYIAAVLKDARHKVAYLDEQILGSSSRLLRNSIKVFSPDVTLLSSTTLSWPAVTRLSRIIKNISREIIVGVGGPHLTLYPHEALACQSIDFGVYGEGEVTILEVLKRIRDSHGLGGIKGCIFRNNGSVIVNAMREPITDLDTVPFPAIGLLPYKKYFALSVKYPFFPMVTSRGCPYHCKFCFQGYLGSYRTRSAENIVEEMALLVNKYNIREIIVFDETFAAEESRVFKICDLIRKKGIKFKWDIRTRVDLLGKGMLESLLSAGCKRLHLGIESGDEDILCSMDKGIGIAEIREKVGLAKKIGFEVRGYFMLGYPGETAQTMRRTIDFAKSLPLDWASFTVTVGLPRTKIFEEALEKKYFAYDYWAGYARGDSLALRPYFIPDGMKEAGLFALKRKAYREFYLRPRMLWNMLKALGPLSLAKNLSVFIRLLPSIYRSVARV